MLNTIKSSLCTATTTHNTIPFVQKYAPTHTNQILYPSRKIQKTIAAISQQKISCTLLLAGRSGIGKTSICNLLPFEITKSAKIKHDTHFINASALTSKAKIVSTVSTFANTIGFSDKRFVILDEADGLDKEAQNALKGVIDEFGLHTMFMLTTNNIGKIDAALKSRCNVLEFGMLQNAELMQYAKQILEAENASLDVSVLKQIVDDANGDVRTLLADLEVELL